MGPGVLDAGLDGTVWGTSEVKGLNKRRSRVRMGGWDGTGWVVWMGTPTFDHLEGHQKTRLTPCVSLRL